MSAKLLKTLAKGKSCCVENIISGAITVYWPNDKNELQHVTILSGSKVDLLKLATVSQLRKSPNLKKLAGKSLRILSDE